MTGESTRPARGVGRIGWLAVLLAPLLSFALLEGALRAAGIGEETDFFVASPDGEAWNTNYHFGRRFFTAAFQIHPDPLVLPRERSPDELRIVLLGGSAAFGDLDWGYGVGRFLEAMFRVRFPDREVRVVSGALPGANSHVMRLAAADVAKVDPDLVLVYLGNNEVIGPYGTGSIVTNVDETSYRPQLWAIRTNLWITSFRVGQLMAGILAGGSSASLETGGAAAAGRPERPIRESDPRLRLTREHFARNMRDLISAPRDAGVPVLVATVPVNLRDVEPLRSLHAPGLSPDREREWDRLRERAGYLAGQGSSAEALAAYDEAARIDATFAALSFERGRALERASRPAEAFAAYVRARELDTLRARADTGLNEVLRRVSREQGGVELGDVEAAWPAPGREHFYDHCHLTLQGNHRLAAALFPAAIDAAGIEATDEQRKPPGLRRMRAELAVTAWDRYQLAHRQATRGLFPGQLRPAPPSLPNREALERSRDRYRSVLEARPEDLPIRERLAELELALGEPARVVAEADQLLFRVAAVPRWLRLRGLGLAGVERSPEALADFDAALRIDPGFRRVRLDRASLRAELGDWTGAIDDLQSALSFKPGDLTEHLELARIALAQGRRAQALAQLEHAAQVRPDSEALAELTRSLGRTLGERGATPAQ